MPRVSTNISLDADLKAASQKLYSDLGLDLSTAITLFLKKSLMVQGLPFSVRRNVPNDDTLEALREYEEMKLHPEKYKRYATFKEAMREVLTDA